MKSTHSFKKNSWIALLSTVFIVGLVACDSSENTAATSSSSTSATKRNMPTGPAVGILVDSPVSGVSYKGSSGKSGTTDEQGNFNFNHSDKIEFKLGGLTLGNIPGSQIVTPIELAGDNNNKLQNLLILLQSLDSDSDLSLSLIHI